MSRSAGVTAHVLSSWSTAIPDALDALPAMSTVSTELVLSLLALLLARGGRAAITTRAGRPTAVLGLQAAGRMRWASFANWLIPGFVGVVDGDPLSAFASLHREVHVAWWRMPVRPSHPAIRELIETPVHGIRVADRVAFWQSTGWWKDVVRTRRRCAHLDISVDEPGAAEWIIRSAAAKWGGESARLSLDTDLRVETARHLSAEGRLHTIVLRDGARRLAGRTCLHDDDTFVFETIYRDQSVGSLPTGLRLYDEGFELAERLGIASVDLGGGYAHKARWAPVNGSRYDVILSPDVLYRARRAAARIVHHE